MMLFNGLDQILMHVISQTSHSKGVEDEARFNAVIEAMFGDNDISFNSQPYVCNFYEMRKILLLIESEKLNISKAIRSVISKKYMSADGSINDETSLLSNVETIRKSIKRNRWTSRDFEPLSSNQDIIGSLYYDEGQKKSLVNDRHEIFRALRKAGW